MMRERNADGEEEARKRDETDELREFRENFYRPEGQIYLDGNSLGLWSENAENALLDAVKEWKTRGVDGWTESGWFTKAEELAARIAPLVGAEPEEVCVANSTTVNLHQLLATLYDAKSPKTKILTDALAFPSDSYALTSFLRGRGKSEADLVRVESRDGVTLDENDIIDALTPDIQIAVLPSVIYTSGQLLDIEKITAEARKKQIVIGWDCAHSIGAIAHELSAAGADFAFWCHYKYLNAGPGAPGGLYLNRRHFGRPPGLAGWFGANKTRQFDMAQTLTHAENAGALQIGTPPILALAPLSGALEIIEAAGIERLRQKSLALTAYLREFIERELSEFGFQTVTPRADEKRGGHLALVHPNAVRICRALKDANVVVDFRPPNIVRLAPVALYTSFFECFDAVRRLEKIMDGRVYERFPDARAIVA